VIPIVALSSGGVANATASDTAASTGEVAQRAVSFTVQNVNRSKTPCHADGATYTVHGHLTGTSQSLADWQSVTLLLHGLSYGEFFGDFTAVDGYNLARWQAESGHATDRGLQLRRHRRPDGALVLRHRRQPRRNGRPGHCDPAVRRRRQRQAGDSGPEGYVYFGADTPAKFIEAHFFTPNADPTVVDATAKMGSRDPCGDVTSYKAAVKSNLANVSKINVPTLVLTGAKDAIYPVPADEQAKLLTGSSDVTAITIPATGHALTLHRSAGVFSTQVANWLTQKGLGGWAMPAGAPQTGGGSTSSRHFAQPR